MFVGCGSTMMKMISLVPFFVVVLIVVSTSSGRVVSRCGFSSPDAFETWNGLVETDLPIVYPKNDAQLAKVIRTAKKNGCKVRPTGLHHSSGGLVAQKDEVNVVVVSLANYKPNRDWNGLLDEERLRVRMPAGATFLDVMSLIRPKGYLLETVPVLVAFSVAGVFMNPSCHGSAKNADRMSTYVTGLTAMKSDGSVIEVTKPADVYKWRGSMGLLGIVTAVEFRIVRDAGMKMTVNDFHASSWSKSTVTKWFSANIKNVDGMEVFLNPYTDRLLALNTDFDGEPGFNASETVDFYAGQKHLFPQLAKYGRPPESPPQGMTADTVSTILDAVMDGTATNWLNAGTVPRDGYLLYPSSPYFPQVNVVAKYFRCPKDCIKDGTVWNTMNVARAIIRRARTDPASVRAPLGLVDGRFLTVQPGQMLLEHLKPGKYFVLEIAEFRLGYDQTHGPVFAAVEAAWIALGGVNGHHGKEWGYAKINPLPFPYPFRSDKVVSSFYTKTIKTQFTKYMRQMDPSGTFLAGEAAHLLGVSNVKFDPRHSSVETSQGSITSCDLFGNSICLSGCCCVNSTLCAIQTEFQQCTSVRNVGLMGACKVSCSCQSGRCVNGVCV